MNYCHVSRQIADHAHELGQSELLHERIIKRADELMAFGEEFYPFNLDNIDEALASLSMDKKIRQAESYTFSPESVGQMQLVWIYEYWAEKAQNKAIEELKHE